jgi:Holliday junction resolvasome RuvABC endonuclease subunit
MSDQILALDLGRSVGWAVGTTTGDQVTSGVLVLPHDPRHRALAGFWRWLEERLTDEVVLVAYESPLARISSWAQTLPLALETLVLLSVGEPGDGLAVRSVAPNTLKKHATGDGRAKKEKMIAAMRERWSLPDLISDHEADALAVLAWALEMRT